MSTLRLNVDTTNLTEQEVDDLLLSAAKQRGYKEQIENIKQEDGTLIDSNESEGAIIDNPTSAMDFYATKLGDIIRNDAKSYNAVKAAEAAREQAKSNTDTIADKASVSAERVD